MSRVFALCLVTISVVAHAQVDAGIALPLRVQARSLVQTATIGEPFAVEVMITHGTEQRYELPAPGDLGAFDLVNVERRRVDGTDSSTTVFKLSFAGFELGKQTTPELTFEITDPNGVMSMPVHGTEIDIVSTLPPDAEKQGDNMFDIRGPMELPIRTWRLVYIVLGIVGGLALAYAIYRYVKRPRPVVLIEKPLLPLHVRTLQALDDLARENLPAQNKMKEFYFRLSEIVRGYLGERYSFEALESTTPELLASLNGRHTPGLSVEELRAFAEESDFIRYAKLGATVEQCKHAMEFAHRMVHITTSAMAVTPPSNATPPKPPAPTT